MKTFKLLLGIAIITLFINCSNEEEAPPNDSSVMLEWEIGRNDYNMMIDGAIRNFIIHVPQNYDASTSFPVVFMLHGASGNGQKFYNISRWKEKGDEEGIISVYPTAIAYKLDGKPTETTRWSTPGLPDILEDSTTMIKDDIVFLNEILTMLSATFNIDENKKYCVGFSNGGGFIRTRAYIEMAEQFAAFGTSGGLSVREESISSMELRRSLFMLLGTRDKNLVEGSGTMEEVPISGNDFINHEFYGDLFRMVLNLCELEDNFSEEPNQPKYNILKFEDAKTSFNNKLYLGIINDLEHNYANEINNPHGVVATNLYWNWFQSL